MFLIRVRINLAGKPLLLQTGWDPFRAPIGFPMIPLRSTINHLSAAFCGSPACFHAKHHTVCDEATGIKGEGDDRLKFSIIDNRKQHDPEHEQVADAPNSKRNDEASQPSQGRHLPLFLRRSTSLRDTPPASMSASMQLCGRDRPLRSMQSRRAALSSPYSPQYL